MYETTRKPLIYQASDANFRNPALKDETYFTPAFVDKENASFRIGGNKKASDSIMLLPDGTTEGVAIKVQGITDCSMASVFSASDQTLPGILFLLSILSMASSTACPSPPSNPPIILGNVGVCPKKSLSLHLLTQNA
ncbi:MAG: hypothetical protein HDT07_05435 [Bacteroidales bacterium]|nr:hypothetical protein [Bacteroidales bacterium]